MDKIINYVESHTQIVVYGAGQVAKELYKDLIKRDIVIDCFVVSNLIGQNNEIDGIPVKTIDDIHVKEGMGIIVGTSMGKVKGIIHELEKREFNDYLVLNQEYIDSILDTFTRPKMEITTVIGCKINCHYCPQKVLMHAWHSRNQVYREEMSYETFKICLDKIPQSVQIYFAGMAEAFQNARCMDMIKYAVTNGYQVGVYTTGVGLSLSDCEKLITLPIKEVVLHVPDEENYAHIELTEEYWQVIELMIKAKRIDGSSFIDSCSCQGTPLRKFLDINKGSIRVETYLHNRAGNLEDSEGKLETSDFIKGKIYCCHSGMRLDHNILLPDGTVTLCCMDYGMKHIIGNLLEKNYEEIINGEAMKNIRYALVNEKEELLCRKCTYAIPYKD